MALSTSQLRRWVAVGFSQARVALGSRDPSRIHAERANRLVIDASTHS